jgi:hypothetical protein
VSFCHLTGGREANLSIRKQPNDPKVLQIFKKGVILKWQVIDSQFSKETCRIIRRDMTESIQFLGLGHLFQQVRDLTRKPHIEIRAIHNDGVYAMSFFPPRNGDISLTHHWRSLCRLGRRQVLQRELGHILGLRHENTDVFSFNGVNEDSIEEVLKILYTSNNDDLIRGKLPKGCELARVSPRYSSRIF